MRQELFCHKCDDYREINVTEKKEIYPVKGEDIEILALVSSCKECGEELTTSIFELGVVFIYGDSNVLMLEIMRALKVVKAWIKE